MPIGWEDTEAFASNDKLNLELLHSGKLTLQGNMDPLNDVFPTENGDIPACYVSLPEGRKKIGRLMTLQPDWWLRLLSYTLLLLMAEIR